jgi:hypothetical protein
VRGKQSAHGFVGCRKGKISNVQFSHC